MTFDNWLVLAILTAAIILFIMDRLRVDLVALLVLVTLILTRLITPEEAFSGFSSPAVITVWAVFIISGALFHSGVADILARMMLRLAGESPQRLLLVIMATVGIMSAFMNNIGAVAILLPGVITISRQRKIPPSKLLMPLAFAALLGGNMTLIGTPPNILAASILQEYGYIEPFKFFDFLPTGMIVLGAGITYMMLIGRHLLPERSPGGDLVDEYPMRGYLTKVRITPNSSLIGQTMRQTGFGERYGLTILQIRRHDLVLDSNTDRPLQADDLLLLEGPASDIVAMCDREGLVVEDGSAMDEIGKTAVSSDSLKLAEITLAPRAQIAGLTLKSAAFRQRYGVSVLAIRHNGLQLITDFVNVPLQFGDTLLVRGSSSQLNLLRQDNNFMMLDMPPISLRRTEKVPLTLFILLGILIALTAGWLNTSATMLIGAVVLVLMGVLSMDEAYASIDWKAVFLIAGMLPLGVAMEKTGTASLLAEQLIRLIGDWGPYAGLAGIFLLTALLTEVISNAAATVLMVPIAIDAAFGLNVAPQPFVMATVIAASTSFLMPIGHQVNVIIYGPGGYAFSDYARVGVGLNMILLLITVFFTPVIWPF